MSFLFGSRRNSNRYVRQALTILSVATILGIGLTFVLGGNANRQTIQILDASKPPHPLYGEPESGEIVGYLENFSGWRVAQTSPSIESKVTAHSGKLILTGSISNVSTPTAVAIIKNTQINIASFPILEFQVNATKGISYGLRVFGEFPNSTMFSAWWEGSPLDHRAGNGPETIRVNMIRQTFLGSGRTVSYLARLEVYVESRSNNPLQFKLELRSLRFTASIFEPLVEQGNYRAVYIDLGRELDLNQSWFLYRIQLGVTIAAEPNTMFSICLLDDQALLTTSVTPSNYDYSSLSPSYDIAFYPHASDNIFTEMLPQSNTSIVLVATTGSLNNVRMDYLDLIYLPSLGSTSPLNEPTLGLTMSSSCSSSSFCQLGWLYCLITSFFNVSQLDDIVLD